MDKTIRPLSLALIVGLLSAQVACSNEQDSEDKKQMAGDAHQGTPIRPSTSSRRPTLEELKAAAARFRATRAKANTAKTLTRSAHIRAMIMPGTTPHYYGPYPNYANSPLPTGAVAEISVEEGGTGYSAPTVEITDLYTGAVATPATATASVDANGTVTGIQLLGGGAGYTAPVVTISDAGTGAGAVATATVGGALAGGIRKFVDPLPTIPVAVPDTMSYPGADYYEISLVEYQQQMHTDLSPTVLRGYVQTNLGTDSAGQNTVSPTPVQYLGPLIVARRDRPVRVKFTNQLAAGEGGNLFLPVDTTMMGAGMGPDGISMYTQNRATIHLHGNNTAWISDGTPHQWITPAGEATPYPKGVSVVNVPDMPDPGDGAMTFYYTNQQSARLMFYHDHAFGISRLTVYGGQAAPYLLTDPVEQDLIQGTNLSGANPALMTLLPGLGIPLVIQDKTFVDAVTIGYQDPTWGWGLDAAGNPVTGSLWYPHVYMPNQNPWDLSGMNAFGRWHYAAWFWPPATGLTYPPIANPHYDLTNAPWEPPMIPATPNPSAAGEAFMDTPVVNGMAYPFLNVEPKVYRLRILNASDDRFLNLQLYVADTATVTADGRTATEVKMVPAVPTSGFPAGWPTDSREGGVPDPASVGPSFIQIGNEGGFLPKPVLLPNQPIDWNVDPTNFDMGNVNKGTLILGTAERADVLVDFSAYAGKTLILYNDAPAAFPANDARYAYHTGGPDLTDIGGTPPTQPGYGPNIRTVLQIRVGTAVTTPFSVNLSTLETAFAKNTAAGKQGVFAASQDEIIVPQAAYNSAYEGSFPADPFVRIFETSKTFQTMSGTPLTLPFQPKAIQDEMGEAFDTEYGRMSAMLGLELPATSAGAQNFILYPYASPPVEIVKGTVYGTPLGATSDGTQVWKITHNGVDTHTVHTHLYSVQLINRVAWDNAIRPPDANELGWKETFRVNPLQDTIVAFRPILPRNLPFQIPNSIRPIDVTMPIGAPLKAPLGGFRDPTGQGVTVQNHLVNFGWEYVYHCHLLAHEEMDMMHSVSVAVAPEAPANLLATTSPGQVRLDWTDVSANETAFVLERASDPAFAADVATFILAANAITYTDTAAPENATSYYRVFAQNVVGDVAVPGFPVQTVTSPASNTVSAAPQATLAAPSGLVAAINASPTRIDLTFTDGSSNETAFAIWRSDNGGAFVQIGTVARTPAESAATGIPVTFSNTTATAPLQGGHVYTYYVTAVEPSLGSSLPSNQTTVDFSAPATPTNLTGSARRIPGNAIFDAARLSWTPNAGSGVVFQIQRSVMPTFSVATTYTTGQGASSFNQNVLRILDFYYRIRAVNAVGASPWSAAVLVNTP